MRYPILIRTKSASQFEAEPFGLPELRVSADSEQSVVERMEEALENWVAQGKIVEIEVASSIESHPWRSGFGRSADDPDFEAFEQELKRERDQQATTEP